MSLLRLYRLLNGLLLLLAMPVLWHFLSEGWQDYTRLRDGQQALVQLQRSLALTTLVTRERLPSYAALDAAARGAQAGAAPGPAPLEMVQALHLARDRTDEALAGLIAAAQAEPEAPGNGLALARLPQIRRDLLKLRAEVDRWLQRLSRHESLTPEETQAYERDPASLSELHAVVQQLMAVADAHALPAMKAYPGRQADVQGILCLTALRESGAVVATLLRPVLRRQVVQSTERLAEIERALGRMGILRELLARQGVMRAEGQPLALAQAVERVRRVSFGRNDQLIHQLLEAARGAGPLPMDVSSFRERYLADMEPLVDLRELLLADVQAHAAGRREQALLRTLPAGTALLLMLGCLMAAMVLLMHRLVRPLVQAAQAIHDMASGRLEMSLPPLRAPESRNEIDAVLGALHKLQGSQRRAAQLAGERDTLIARLRKLSSTDPLTGLLNRRAFFEAAERELANARRHGFEVTVLLLDIDHFKSINDTHGHATGDQALVAVAATLQAGLRQGDVLGRHGGEEFVLLLTHCGRLPGMGFAERLRESIAELALQTPLGGAFGLTASLGLASSREAGLELASLLSQADAAMYRAKRGGRNRVEGLPVDPAPDAPEAA